MCCYGCGEDIKKLLDEVFVISGIIKVEVRVISRSRGTAAWLAQLGERRSTEREVAGSNPGRTNTQGL